MRVLCVAEKPSISKSISQILSGGQLTTRGTQLGYIKNYDFDYPQTRSFYTVTCVTGHLMGADFTDQHRKWNSCDPFALFDAPVDVSVVKDKKGIEKNLRQEAGRADMLMIWTDCDREGEHIGHEIASICRKSKRTITVKRARFSAIIPQQIHRAAQNPVELDMAQVNAVDARIMLDLRIGSALTRLQTLTLQQRVAQLDFGDLVSYGPCQFPTLGFVVARYDQVHDFRPETFWYIYLAITISGPSRDQQETKFTSRRGHIYDEDIAIAIYELVLENPEAVVTKYDTKPTKKWKPLPLTTVELQKAGSRLLKMAPKKVLDIAEKLYQQGFLSYPRTETDQYDDAFDFASLIDKQKADNNWGQFATRLGNGEFTKPRKGKNNDKAHPPIHPTAHASNLAGEEKKVYEYITRRFLASCSKDAEGLQTTVEVTCGGEEFYATGLTVTQRNFLDVYPYEKWADHELPQFRVGDRFQPSVCELREGQTTAPKYLTEADLVNLMDKNGIGTDATIAQHIDTIISRDYVIERMEGSTKYLVPSTLGVGLIKGYNEIGLNKSLSKPLLRRETERNMVRVCQGAKTKHDMLQEAIEQYKEMFLITKREFNKVVESVRRYVNPNQAGGNAQDQRGDNGGGNDGGGGGGGGNRRGGGGGRGGRGAGDPGRRGGARGASNTRGRGGRSGDTGQPRGGPVVEIPSDDDDNRPPPPALRRAPASRANQQPEPSRVPKPPLQKQVNAKADGNCSCGVPAKAVTDNGQRFWSCGTDKACGHFEFIPDDPDSVVPTKRNWTSMQTTQGDTSSAARQCQCNEEAVLKTTMREGVNQGRQFWTCRKNMDDSEKCKFFEWADEPPRNGQGPAGSLPRTGNNNPAKTDDTCYKCNKTGHWASNCPNGDGGGPSKKPRNFGNSADNVVGQKCFKCDQPGHFANACPNDNASNTGFGSNGRTKSGGNSGSGSGECFNCGQTGHWSNACPNKGSNHPSGKSSTRGRSASHSKSSRGGRGRGKGSGTGAGKKGRGAKSKFGEA